MCLLDGKGPPNLPDHAPETQKPAPSRPSTRSEHPPTRLSPTKKPVVRGVQLIHGGLRYLEHFHFRLVREALIEREVLLTNAPHIIWPLRFILPHHRGLRPRWLLRLGLFIYDHLGGRHLLPATRTIDLESDPAGAPLRPNFRTAFEYSDCWVDDARLVVLNARDAADRGACIETHTEVTAIAPAADGWRVTVRKRDTGQHQTVHARLVVNAAGPWVDRVLARVAGAIQVHKIRLVQGSHIVVPKLFDHPHGYIFQNGDDRVVFAIPFEDDFTLIGTTDRDYEGDPGDVRITDEEISYLCEAVGEYFATAIAPENVFWSYSGVRPLFDDGSSRAQEATRDYVLSSTRTGSNDAIMINVFGGKITTYRKLSEAVLAMIEDELGSGEPAWTETAPLPGGDFQATDTAAMTDAFARTHAFLDPAHARRLIRTYGTRANRAIADAKSASDLGRHFGGDLFEAEIRYLVEQEWARTGEDILWRRTKRGLRLTDAECDALDRFVASVVTSRHTAQTDRAKPQEPRDSSQDLPKDLPKDLP